ncbi:hypothetical protein [Agromyces sp. ZXT2-6]|uniref:hypothetical protein n=1 Tax=Agromyces sp. ZXT2-6 TaxID=3461153 RepID=UPI004054C6C8
MGEVPEMLVGRVAASHARVSVLTTAFAQWLSDRHQSDTWQQYRTQLDTISAVVDNCLGAVAATIPPADDDWLLVYEACRLADRRAVWVERVWRFFAERFDQRDGPESRKRCIQAADEVLWSCWRPCFADGSAANTRPPLAGAVPLPYLDPVHAPEAFPAGLVPADLAATYADAPFVREHLARLPVPTVRVPVAATYEPWLLSLIAHETGHHLQFAARLVQAFRTTIQDAVATVNPSDQDAVTRWGDWSVEIFADLVSVALLGQWALWPIAELELGAQQRMSEPRAGYPAAIVRLSLIEHAIVAMNLDPGPAWPSSEAAALVHNAELPDLAYASAVVDAGLRVGPPGFTLASWIGFDAADFAPTGEVQQWRRWFSGGPHPATPPSLRGPRIALAGVVAATADARRADNERRRRLEETVQDHAYQELIALHAPGVRAGGAAEAIEGNLSALAAALAKSGADELEEPPRERVEARR